MQIYYSRPPKPIQLSAQYRYAHAHLLENMEKLHSQGHDIWLTVGQSKYIPLVAQEFSVVAHIISAEHDMIVGENIPYDDGWDQETQEMENNAAQKMTEDTSEEETHTDEDITA